MNAKDRFIDFGQYSEDELIKLVESGLSPNECFKKIRDGKSAFLLLSTGSDCTTTVFKHAIIHDLTELIKVCIRKGANPNRLYTPFFGGKDVIYSSSLRCALINRRYRSLRVLLENGADPRYLYIDQPRWHMQKNLLPEMDHIEDFSEKDQESLLKLKKRLDVGLELVKVLRDFKFRIPCSDMNNDTLSLCRFDTDFVNHYYSFMFEEEVCNLGSRFVRWEGIEENFDCFNGFIETDYYSESDAFFDEETFLPRPGSRQNALWHAVSPEALQVMLRNGVDVNMRDENGYTALHHIVSTRNFASPEFFDSGSTSKHNYYFQPEKMLEILIQAKADVNDDKNNNHIQPIRFALRYDSDFRQRKENKFVEILLNAGAKF